MSSYSENQKCGLNHVEWQRTQEDDAQHRINQRGVILAKFALKHDGLMPHEVLDPHDPDLTSEQQELLFLSSFQQARLKIEQSQLEQN